MKRLILMRHAKSDWSQGGEDHDRPLNARGTRDATALGDWLRGQGVAVDQVLCSSARRTQDTLAGLALGDVPAEVTRRLYLATHNDILGAIREAAGETVLVVGHNPGISISAAQLLCEMPEHRKFEAYPTGATLVADCDVESWGKLDWGHGRLHQFTVPRDL